MCSFFVASWTGVVKYHGPKPSMRPKQVVLTLMFLFLNNHIHLLLSLYFLSWFEQVFVANHTSMIDFIILEQMTAFAVIMQKHPGWVGKRYC